MKKMNRLFLFGMTLSFLTMTACNNDDDSPSSDPTPTGDYVNGVLIVNEGGFGAANASVGFIGENGVYQPEIFKNVNGENLGDVAQSIYTHEDKAYIVLNGSGTMEVVNRYTFEKEGTISSGLANPRYVIIENNKAYVSNWGDPTNPDDDYLAVVNLNSLTVESTISVVEGPEKMTSKNGKVFVAHMGGWGYGNSVSVINTSNNTVSANLSTADVPHGIFEENNYLYVLCSGKAAWTGDETQGGLYVFDISTNNLIFNHSFATGVHPSHLEKDNGTLYYTIDDKVFSADFNALNLPTVPLFSLSDQGVYGVYGFAVNNGKIYVADAGDYVSNGKIFVYSSDSGDLTSYSVGLLPNSFGFN